MTWPEILGRTRGQTTGGSEGSRSATDAVGSSTMLLGVPTTTIVEVAAARPNFMKVAPIHRAAAHSSAIEPILVHAGQHYDAAMSAVFFSDLGLPEPDIHLAIGSGSHAEQTARVLTRLERHLVRLRPAAVLVVGDVNSTLAAALCAAKLRIPVVHVEAGLRSGDRQMPEEINRVMTDAISEVLFAPSQDAVENLLREGHPEERINMVGNVMIDSLEAILPKTEASSVLRALALEPRGFFLATLHRPSNVDRPKRLAHLVEVFESASQLLPLVFVVHPRTMEPLLSSGGYERLSRAGVRLVEPLGYLDFLALERASAAVLTDSGGLQEETTVLGVPCLTLRRETERPITVTDGTNQIVGDDRDAILKALTQIAEGGPASPRRPPLWDGRTAERIVDVLEDRFA